MEWFNKEDNLFSYQSSGMGGDDGQKLTDDVGEAVDFHVMTPIEWDERIKNTFHINGNNPDFADEHGVLLLFHAINFGTSDVVRFLLEAGADANSVSWQGHSPWFLAVDSKNMAKIHLLEKIHADQTIQNNLGHNALHLIAMRGDIRLFHYLIHHAPLKAVLAVNRWGNSLLHLTASRHRHLLMRICLTHAEIPIDLENHDGETAFLKAVKSGDLSIARLLMENGADINLSDHSGFHPMIVAIRYMKHDEKTLQFLQDMLSAGARPDMSDHWGETPLFLAVKRHWTDAVALLLKYPVDVHHLADPELRNRKDCLMSPIMVAVEDRQTEIARLLLSSHADPNSILNKKTLLYCAVEQHCPELAELLLAFGADGKAISKEIQDLPTPIQKAIINEDVPMINIFLSKVEKPLDDERTKKMIDKISNVELHDMLSRSVEKNN